jgi:hypothetical protein
MGWVDNVDEVLNDEFLQITYTINNNDVPSSLVVNSNQGQLMYVQGSSVTYAPTGSKQVPTLGAEDKQAITMFLSVTNNGVMLPIQRVFHQYPWHQQIPHHTLKLYPLASFLSPQRQGHIGQHKKQCATLLTVFWHHILIRKRWNWDCHLITAQLSSYLFWLVVLVFSNPVMSVCSFPSNILSKSQHMKTL